MCRSGSITLELKNQEFNVAVECPSCQKLSALPVQWGVPFIRCVCPQCKNKFWVEFKASEEAIFKTVIHTESEFEQTHLVDEETAEITVLQIPTKRKASLNAQQYTKNLFRQQ